MFGQLQKKIILLSTTRWPFEPKKGGGESILFFIKIGKPLLLKICDIKRPSF